MMRIVLWIVLAAAASSCAVVRSEPVYTSRVRAEANLPEVSGEDLMKRVLKYQGAGYRGGGESPPAFDCSGLVRAVFSPFGVVLPRTSAKQFGEGVPVGKLELRLGDLVFFGQTYVPSHVGIAVSATEMIHASVSKGVVLEGIDAYVASCSGLTRLVGMRRIVRLR